MLLTPEQILHHRYRIDVVLSDSGVINLYQGWDLSFDVPIVVKETVDTSPEARRFAQAEAKQLLRLAHPNIGRVNDYIFVPRKARYLIYDWIEGDMLADRLAQNIRFQPVEALYQLTEICNALTHLHHQPTRLVHGNLTPRNIRMRPDGQIVLVSCGGNIIFNPALRQQNHPLLYHPDYSAPEQHQAEQPTASSDIYAVGVLAYQMLTGAVPAEEAGDIDDPAVTRVLNKALAASPSTRYSSGGQLRTALQRALAPAQEEPFILPNGSWTVAVGMIVLGLFACVILSLTSLVNNSQLDVSRLVLGETTPIAATRPALPTPTPLGTATLPPFTGYNSVSFGFSLNQPVNWQRQTDSLQVIFAPTRAGLTTSLRLDAAIWAGVYPADEATNADILRGQLTHFPNNAQLEVERPMQIGGQTWRSIQITFEAHGLPQRAIIASAVQNEVGYFLVLTSPEVQWAHLRLTFQTVVDSFAFRRQAAVQLEEDLPELPPTPTATPTPIMYVIESGDTLGYVSRIYEVSIAELQRENGLRDGDILRVGQEIFIPRRR